MIRRLLVFVLFVVVPGAPNLVLAQSPAPSGRTQGITLGARPAGVSGQNPQAAADQLFASGKTAQAAAAYQAILSADPASVPAEVGLVRSYMMLQKMGEAQSAINTALTLNPNSWVLQLTLGDLEYANGRIPESERAYIKAENLKPDEAAPYLGLARVYRVYSLYRRAYDNLKRAHELAPNELAVQLLWFNALPHQDRVPALEAYLAEPGVNPQIANKLRQYLAFLKKNADAPVHACKLVSNVKETNTKLYAIPRSGTELGASGLNVKINNQELHLALDTGSSGVLLGRAAADKLKLQRVAYQPIMGVGDSGQQGGFTALADRIRVGDLEFRDCTVRVTDAATPVTGQDGLIGSDVFSAYLVDIDIPGAKLRLSPLPKRPDEIEAPAALKTISQDGQELEAEGPENQGKNSGKGTAPALTSLPKDAYVAPEMANWTKAYRFRSLLLIPTKVDRLGPLLFLIDTGSFSNVLSTRTAQEITQLRADPGMSVKGMSGTVSKIYRADKATLQFGRYEQENQDVVTFDLSSVCKQTGTDVSGILGFNMLRILQTKIDYRDGLVDFVYDPNHLPKQVKLNK
ncbi:MAG TPA: aspartyl protease family protein [Terriglobales bacterium]|nr:aspartyl protease family protein [Terriglobales bacterium]